MSTLKTFAAWNPAIPSQSLEQLTALQTDILEISHIPCPLGSDNHRYARHPLLGQVRQIA